MDKFEIIMDKFEIIMDKFEIITPNSLYYST